MTEDEARTKICPLGAGVVAGMPGTTLHVGTHLHRTTCIASECMAWRWADRRSEADGYCGQAGRP